jgi:predicted DCC family thiol-disulfide oxidoreductase YuxK
VDKKTERTIVFYDGTCGFCQFSIQICLKFDKSKKLLFAPQSSEYAQKIGLQDQMFGADSIVVCSKEKFYLKSEAIFIICKTLGFPLHIFLIFKYLLPKTLCNSVYDFVARNRKKWMGENKKCLLLTPEQRSQFLL